MLRRFYTLLFSALLPLILLRLYWRGIKAPQYRQRWRERLGCYQTQPRRHVIWLHAVSVGEAEAGFALLNSLQQRYPAADFLITTTTPTGSARVQTVLTGNVAHVYLPYDIPYILNRFFQHFQPRIAIIMEKEIWPNLYAGCAARRIPIAIVNARLSPRSAASYQKIPGLLKPALAQVNLIACQTSADSQRFQSIGASPQQLKVPGNIKFDMHIPAAVIEAGRELHQQLFINRFVWIIASSHQGEEALILSSYAQLKQRIPELLLLIVPRHPERFTDVEKLCLAQHLQVVMRSRQQQITSACDVYIADSIGELKMLYAAADAAFVGGSLVPVGGHNVLEPAAVGTPILFGPHMFNFQDIAEQMLAANAAQQCQDPAALALALLKLYQEPGYRQTLVSNAQTFVRQNQGATTRLTELLAAYL
ncbi:lipid IV(A) 3-deoxy-D-manno-octulosonic acid transferase [Methylomonas paludis]|uniref:lipid IV(A) 3-deoxy-D-manno-octulosonic acid transferase n=1 Tax=Methylomonas paludis TaxID=1173101 RepID=UPI0031BB0D9D